jgi:hypothetical protein
MSESRRRSARKREDKSYVECPDIVIGTLPITLSQLLAISRFVVAFFSSLVTVTFLQGQFVMLSLKSFGFFLCPSLKISSVADSDPVGSETFSRIRIRAAPDPKLI